MRPPEFTGGNPVSLVMQVNVVSASMRPPEFTGGNPLAAAGRHSVNPCFNEAAGIHRRKPGILRGSQRLPLGCFNEAAGIHRRKLPVLS